MEQEHATGALASPFDLRTFVYNGLDKAGENIYEVGESWEHSKFIEDQHSVGICTSISMTMKARKHFDIDFSDDFQYLLQKKFIDGNWNEGSSAFSACKVGHKYGFLPQSEWNYTSINDRKLSYDKYITKLRAIPDAEINRLLAIAAKYKIKAYAKIAQNTEAMGAAISENGSLIARFVTGKEWYSSVMNKNPEQPLRQPAIPVSGHLVNITKRHGDSYRIANSWGTDWARGGTAYGLFSGVPMCRPTEMWQVWFADIPQEIDEQLEQRKRLLGQIKDLLQQLLELLRLQNLAAAFNR